MFFMLICAKETIKKVIFVYFYENDFARCRGVLVCLEKEKERKGKKRKEEERKPIFLLCVSVIPYNFDFNK